MPEEPRIVTAQTKIYLGGLAHPFRPGDSVPLPAAAADALLKAKHLDAPTPQKDAPAAGEQPAQPEAAEAERAAATPAEPADPAHQAA